MNSGLILPYKQILAFTGTRSGMTLYQMATFAEFVRNTDFDLFIHGDCVGADKQAHKIVRNEKNSVRIEVYPALSHYREWAGCNADLQHEMLSPLHRNRIMARRCKYLFAAPNQFQMILRSGTWATVRYARKSRREITICYPGPVSE